MATVARRILAIGLGAGLLFGLLAPTAHAYEFTRTLQRGDSGPDVLELQIRVSGWFARRDQTHHEPNGTFGARTKRAVMNFQRRYGLEADGVAGASTFEVLNSLERKNRSTANFTWAEFKQKRNSRCSEEANKYAGTFKGGMIPHWRVRENVRRLMWRLEALRKKGGDKPIGINSGFRSVAYNKCIGGASLSQHMYGTAVDMRVMETDNRATRNRSRGSQFSGIGCYSQYTHNHLDLRVENEDLSAARYWWWPKQDEQGRDLDSRGDPCWGEKAKTTSGRMVASAVDAVATWIPGADSVLPSPEEIEAFTEAPESPYHSHAD